MTNSITVDLPMPPLTERQEEVLSYLTGLKPVGSVIGFEIKAFATEMHASPNAIRPILHALIGNGSIELVDKINTRHEYRVVRRLEDREAV